MKAYVGGRLVLHGIHVGDPPRVGVSIAVPHPDYPPPHQVRRLDIDHETLAFRGPEARVEARTRVVRQTGR